MFTRADFETHIQKIVKDLDIGNVTIRFDFVQKYLLDKKHLGMARTWRGKDGWLAVVKIAVVGHEFSDMVDTLAHELRHVWQDSKGIMHSTYVAGDVLPEEKYRRTRNGYYRIMYCKNSKYIHTWSGTEYAEAQTFSRCEYFKRPNEIDARGYAADYVAGKKRAGTQRKMINKIGGVTFYKFS